MPRGVTAADLRVLEARFFPHEARDFFEERAAIFEFDGGLTREAAEEMARERLALWWERTQDQRRIT